jgi:transposase-like protein
MESRKENRYKCSHFNSFIRQSTKSSGHTYKVNGIGILGLQAAAGMTDLLIPIGMN